MSVLEKLKELYENPNGERDEFYKKHGKLIIIGVFLGGVFIIWVIIQSAGQDGSSSNWNPRQQLSPPPPPPPTEAPRLSTTQIAEQNTQCLRNVDCIIENTSWLANADSKCKTHIENYARYDYKWTNGWIDPIFASVSTKPPDYKTALYIGDAVQFQNGFGAFQRMGYSCEFDPIGGEVITVVVAPR